MNVGRIGADRAHVVRIDEGHVVEYRGRNKHRIQTVRIDSLYYVYDPDGHYLGRIARVMRNRETRSKGRVYVNTRWSSPAWVYETGNAEPSFATPHFSGLEASSRNDAVDRILWRTGARS